MAINFSASFAACLAAGIKVPRQFMYCIAQDTGAPYVLYKDSGGGAGGDWGEFPQSPEPSLQPSPSPPYHNSTTPGQQQQPQPPQQQGQPPQQPPQQQGPPLPPQQGNFSATPNRALTPHRPPTSLVHSVPVEDDVQQQSQPQQQGQQPPPQQQPQSQPPPPQPPQQQQQSTQTPQQPNPPQPPTQQELGVGCDLSQSYYGGGRGTQHMLSQGFMSYLKQPVVLTSLNPNDPVPDYTGFHMTTGMPDLLSGSLKASPVSGVTGVKSELRLFKCLTCGKDFKQKSTLLQHERIHTDSRPYGCSECGKRFRQQSHLTQHLRIHANEKPFACIYCERTFRQRAILNQHLRIHSDVSPHLVYKNGQLWPQDVPFPQDKDQNQGFDLQPDSQCFSPDSQFPAYFKDSKGVAHGVFGTGNGKTLPEMIQSGRNAGLPLYVRCPICQKEFKQKSTLLQHGCIHIESRPYPCGECGKRFRQQSHLTQHLRIHTNEKPYGCLYCGRNFRQRTILNQHVRIHTGEKPYKCAQCGKDFRQKAILDQHTRTHQGDRPYCCPLPNCRRRFAAESEVKRHVENHVGPKRKPPPPGVSMNPTPLVKPELYLPQCYPHPGNFQQQYTMSQLLGSPPQPTALVQ